MYTMRNVSKYDYINLKQIMFSNKKQIQKIFARKVNRTSS